MRPIVRVIAWLKPWYEPVDRGTDFHRPRPWCRRGSMSSGRRHHVCRRRGRLRLLASHPRCLVAPRCGLRLGPTSMRDLHRQCSKLRLRPSSRRPAPPIIPTAARSTMPSILVPNLRAELLDASDGALNPRRVSAHLSCQVFRVLVASPGASNRYSTRQRPALKHQASPGGDTGAPRASKV